MREINERVTCVIRALVLVYVHQNEGRRDEGVTDALNDRQS